MNVFYEESKLLPISDTIYLHLSLKGFTAIDTWSLIFAHLFLNCCHFDKLFVPKVALDNLSTASLVSLLILLMLIRLLIPPITLPIPYPIA